MPPVRFMQQCFSVTWHIAMKPSQRKMLRKDNACDVLVNALEKLKAGIRAKVEHPFRVVKRQFGCTLVRYRALKKNTAQYVTLFALSNLWMVRSKLMGMQACARLQIGKRPGRR